MTSCVSWQQKKHWMINKKLKTSFVILRGNSISKQKKNMKIDKILLYIPTRKMMKIKWKKYEKSWKMKNCVHCGLLCILIHLRFFLVFQLNSSNDVRTHSHSRQYPKSSKWVHALSQFPVAAAVFFRIQNNERMRENFPSFLHFQSTIFYVRKFVFSHWHNDNMEISQ